MAKIESAMSREKKRGEGKTGKRVKKKVDSMKRFAARLEKVAELVEERHRGSSKTMTRLERIVAARRRFLRISKAFFLIMNDRIVEMEVEMERRARRLVRANREAMESLCFFDKTNRRAENLVNKYCHLQRATVVVSKYKNGG